MSTRQLLSLSTLLGAFLVDALENDAVDGLNEYTADNLLSFLTRQTDKDLVADLINELGGKVWSDKPWILYFTN